MAAYPVFGIGISNFQKAECTIVDAKRELVGDTPNCTAPHNSLIQISSELGVPGGILWISLLGGGCAWLLVLRRRVPDAWRRGTPEEKYLFGVLTFLPVAIVGFAVSSLFVSFAYASPAYILIALMAVTTVEVRTRLVVATAATRH
jgi:O-antigen ligase